MENWFLRITQMLIMIAVSGTIAQMQLIKNGVVVGACGAFAAIAFTVIYGKIADWFIARRLAREQPPEPEADERWP